MTDTQLLAGIDGQVLVVVPCSGAKLWHQAPAGELYTGSWHRLARSAGDSLVQQHGGQVVILSALHGLLQLDQLVEPYDLRMGEAGAVTPATLALQLLALLDGDHDLQVVALLPRAYLQALQAAVEQLPLSQQPVVHAPLVGATGVGYQRQRLVELRDARVPA